MHCKFTHFIDKNWCLKICFLAYSCGECVNVVFAVDLGTLDFAKFNGWWAGAFYLYICGD